MYTSSYLPVCLSVPFPEIWLGTWVLGGMHFGLNDYSESQAVIQHAFELGIRHFDTAYFYAHGQSDRLLKPLCQTVRQDIFISAKGGLCWQGKQVYHDASASSLRKTLEQSLLALGTDYIDLFTYHSPDPKLNWQAVRATLCQFQREGLIRFWGVSNMTVDDPVPHQIHFNPIHRDVIPTHAFTVAYSPLEQGLLAKTNRFFSKKDRRRRNPYFHNADVNAFLSQLQLHCDDPIMVTLRWILAQPPINAVILGPRTVAQLDILWAALQCTDAISKELWAYVSNGPFN